MKYGLFFANSGPFAIPENFEALVRTADEVGIESIWTVEHVVIPVGYGSPYPYAKSGKIPGGDDISVPDPMLSLAYAAALTTRLRLATGIMILPQRHPVYVAKEFATLDVLSRGRAIAGIGIGWLEEEFDVVGVPFRQRVGRTEESVRAIRSLWKEKSEPFDGKYYNWNLVESNPKPVQKPGVPFVVGGHVEGAARRAARIGDGFFPAKGNPALLRTLLSAMGDECAKLGRDPAEIEITTTPRQVDADSIREYEELGVTRLVIPPPAFEPEGIVRELSAFAEKFIA